MFFIPINFLAHALADLYSYYDSSILSLTIFVIASSEELFIFFLKQYHHFGRSKLFMLKLFIVSTMLLIRTNVKYKSVAIVTHDSSYYSVQLYYGIIGIVISMWDKCDKSEMFSTL